eukprot:scaffold214527_cov31-Attheya_sp.AAC.1
MSEDAPPPHNGPAREGEEEGEKTTSIRIASYNIQNGRAGGWRRLYALYGASKCGRGRFSGNKVDGPRHLYSTVVGLS